MKPLKNRCLHYFVYFKTQENKRIYKCKHCNYYVNEDNKKMWDDAFEKVNGGK